jgi:hypothetical protein
MMVNVIQPPDDEKLEMLVEALAQQLRQHAEEKTVQFMEQLRELASEHCDLEEWTSALAFDMLTDLMFHSSDAEALFRQQVDRVLHGEQSADNPDVIEGSAIRIVEVEEADNSSDQDSKSEG